MPACRIIAATLLALLASGMPPALADAIRPQAELLPVPLGGTREQVLLGDRIFHGEAAGGRCSICHGVDAKGTPNGNDLTVGMWSWGDGSTKALKTTVTHNMEIAPGMDGALTPADVDAVVAYVWALGHQKN